MQAVVDAAKVYTTLFSNKEVVTIDVGFGEIGGSPLASADVGESNSLGIFPVDYSTVTSVLAGDGFAFSAANEPMGGSFFVTTAEAKAMGLIDSTGGLPDGLIGFGDLSGTGFSWNTKGTAIGPTQIDLVAVAEHEISEVMGRLGLEDATDGFFTPLDLYNYQSPGVLSLSPNGGYFSINDGKSSLGNFNNAGFGDTGDWASLASITQSGTLGLAPGSFDAYDAFAYPGANGQVSLSDIIEDAALGYTFKPGLLGNYMASFAAAGGLSGGVTAQDGQALDQQPLLSHPHT
jgi:hypothetical protein